jgi:ABC-type molybdenum transport system ATPase subunit/photorepair protein PhrA
MSSSRRSGRPRRTVGQRISGGPRPGPASSWALPRWSAKPANNRGGLSAARAIRRNIERCDGFVDALYLLAVLHRGDPHLAEEAVIDAIASAAIDPLILASDGHRTWQLLATHFHAANEPSVFHGSPQPLVRGAGLSIGQRETMAIAQVLLAKPDVLLADEATEGLDADAARDLLLTLRLSDP